MSERHRANGRHRRRSRSTSQPLFAVGAVAAAAFVLPGMDAGTTAQAQPATDGTATAPLSSLANLTPAQRAAVQSVWSAGKTVEKADTRASRSRRATPATKSTTKVAAKKAPTKVVKKTSASAVLPVKGFRLTAAFGDAGGHWSSGRHTGQDFAVPSGTTVHVAAAGTVTSAGWGGAYGNRIVVKHSDGRYTTYNHLSKILVSVGKKVYMGQSIALSGNTGNTTGPHLHFEVLNSAETPIPPLTWLRGRGVKI